MKIVSPIGKKGEEVATQYLQKKGYKIIDRNFRKGYGEIDIVAIETSKKLEKILVFIEVKTRTSNQFGSPLEAITPWKLKILTKTAQFYKLIHPKLLNSLRIDAISILLSGNQVKEIEHVKNISGF